MSTEHRKEFSDLLQCIKMKSRYGTDLTCTNISIHLVKEHEPEGISIGGVRYPDGFGELTDDEIHKLLELGYGTQLVTYDSARPDSCPYYRIYKN